MGSELDEAEPISTPKLPLSIIPPESTSPEDNHSVNFYTTSASIPFLWEEEPGKPRPYTAATTVSDHPNTGGPPKSLLELPPRLQQLPESSKTTNKVPSPTTVLDGPYVGLGLAQTIIIQGVPFGFKRDQRRRKAGSFDNSINNCVVGSPEKGQLGDLVLLSKRGGEIKESRRGGLFRAFGRRQRSMVRSSSMGDMANSGGSGRSSRWEWMPKIRRQGSFSSLTEAATKSNFWATMYEGFKQVLPWKK